MYGQSAVVSRNTIWAFYANTKLPTSQCRLHFKLIELIAIGIYAANACTVK